MIIKKNIKNNRKEDENNGENSLKKQRRAQLWMVSVKCGEQDHQFNEEQ